MHDHRATALIYRQVSVVGNLRTPATNVSRDSTEFITVMTVRPTITFSSAAINEIKRMRSHHVLQDDAQIQLNVHPGGCMDWHYDLSFTSNQASVNCYPVTSDTKCDLHFSLSEDHQSLLDGLHIDYSEDLMGGGFRFSNPQATQTCGCGNSFSTQDVPLNRNEHCLE